MVRKKESEMFSFIENYKNGDLSRKEFCDQHGLAVSTFDYWHKKYRRAHSRQAASDFIRINAGAIMQDRYLMEVQTRKGSLFRFNELVATEYLSRLMEL